MAIHRRPIPLVLQQHAEESAVLSVVRAVLVGSPHVELRRLRRLDDRLAAHLDGLSVAGDAGSRVVDAALADAGPGECFTAFVNAAEAQDRRRLDRLLVLAAAVPAAEAGVRAAISWVSPAVAKPVVVALQGSGDPFRQRLALFAFEAHRADPGPALDAALDSRDPALRACGLVSAGTAGRIDRLRRCVDALADPDPGCRVAAARAALLLGDRQASLRMLERLAAVEGPQRGAVLDLFLKAAPSGSAIPVLRSLRDDSGNRRLLIRCIGTAGDPHFVPWLIDQMTEPEVARLAGEAFSLMTGADLPALDLECKPPEDDASGPNDDPADEAVAMDEDDGLPWPDPARVSAWWATRASGFQPGVRCFMGAAPSPAHCLAVLETGYQRQRQAAAVWSSLLAPGTPLFPTAAPVARQRRWLDAQQ